MLTYSLTHHAACGMPIPLLTGEEELTTARDRVARRLRYLRAEGFPVTTLERGREWEIGEPDGCMLIPDDSGTLVLRTVKVEVPTCRECDTECYQDGRMSWICPSCEEAEREAWLERQAEEEEYCDCCGVRTCDCGEEGL